ncbi:unnamed protein product [Caenorhabditis brenneri]
MANDVRREAVVVDVTEGAHDQMEVEVYVFKLNKFISFYHPDGFQEYSFIRLRVMNDETGYNAVIDDRRATRLYKFEAEERPFGKGPKDFLLTGVINTNWVLEEDWNEDHFFVDHLTIGLVKVSHGVWGKGWKKEVIIGRLENPIYHNGKECHFQVEKADFIQREDSDDDDDSDSSEDFLDDAFWTSTALSLCNLQYRPLGNKNKMSLQRYDVPFVGTRCNYSEVCVLYDIQRRNQMVSGRAWDINTGLSTPFLDIDYRLRFRHLMRVHFSPDGTACGFESVNHPDWRVCEGRLDSEIEMVKVRKENAPKDKEANKFDFQMIGILDMRCSYHEDAEGKVFNSPVGAIRMNPFLCAEPGRHNLVKVKISYLSPPENFQGRKIYWEVAEFVDQEQLRRTVIFPSSSEGRDPLLQQVSRMSDLLQYGLPRIAYVQSQARYMPDWVYKDLGIFVENCKDLLNEIPFAATREEAKELISDSVRTQDLGVKLFQWLLENCTQSLHPRDEHDYKTYLKMREEVRIGFGSETWIACETGCAKRPVIPELPVT